MKKLIPISIILILTSCSTMNRIDWSNSYWGILETEEAYLYKSNSITSIADKEIKKGSILYFHSQVGDFREVYTRNPKKIDKNYRKNFRYYLYKPKYKKLTNKYNKSSASVYEIPFDPNRSYISGERGGCFYINKHENKTYVNRSYCNNKPKTTTPTYKPKLTPKTNRKCHTVQCSGRTKKGSRCRNKTTDCSGRCHLH